MVDKPKTTVTTAVPMPPDHITTPVQVLGKPVLNRDGNRIGKVTGVEVRNNFVGGGKEFMIEAELDLDDEAAEKLFLGLPPYVVVDYNG